MVNQASYKITDVSATYNSCTVTVTTKNIDFYSLPGTIYDEIKSQITDGNSSLWTSIKNSISSLLGGSSQTSIEKIDISENLKNWYKETKKNITFDDETLYKKDKNKILKEFKTTKDMLELFKILFPYVPFSRLNISDIS